MAANIAGMAFIPYYNHIMKLLNTDEELKKTATGIFKQMAYGVGGIAVGGLVGGPVGAMVGGIAGSVYGYLQSDPYQSMVQVLQDMSDERKAELVSKVQTLVGSTGIEALTSFIGAQVNREMFMHLIKEFSEHVSKGG